MNDYTTNLEDKYREKFGDFECSGTFMHYIMDAYTENDLIMEVREQAGEEYVEKAKNLLKEYKKEKRTSLEEVHEVFHKYLELKDTKRIDVTLAVALSNKSEYLDPLWLLLVGPSGCGKTEQIQALRDPRELEDAEEANTKKISEITENTIVSGKIGNDLDLAPKLDGKMILIYDFAIILNLPSEPKRKVWSQLRELYDGDIGKQAGSGKDVNYTLDQPPSLVACSTPDIDKQLIQKDKLGTRELVYRLEHPTDSKLEDVLDKVWRENESENGNELRKTVQSFLEHQDPDIRMEIPEDVEEIIKLQAERLSYMRAQGDFDNYSNELESEVQKEVPTRALGQLKTFYICLMSLSPEYQKSRALDIIDHIVKSSGNPRREEVIAELAYRGEATSYEISKSMRISQSPIERDLQILWNLGLVDRRHEERENGQKTTIWEIDEEHELYDLMVQEALPERIKRKISKKDEGEGVESKKIFEEISEDEEKIEDAMDLLIQKGELAEVKPGKFQTA